MRQILRASLALALSSALLLAGSVNVVAAAAVQQGAMISGTALSAGGDALAGYTVQLRSVSDGHLVGTTTTDASGNFTFSGLNPDTYMVEVVSPTGAIVGTSAALTLTANASLSVGITASAAATDAGAIAGGAAADAGATTGAAAAESGSTFGPGLAWTLTALAAAGGVTALVVTQTRDVASPSS